MKIVITGTTGVLGNTAYRVFSETYSVSSLNRKDVDFYNISDLYSKLDGMEPNCIIHCAANTNVERCEENQDEAYRDNLIITENIASYCCIKACKLVFVSSTGIYGDWNNKPYTEFDKVSPTTFYHHSKYQAEQVVKRHVKDHLICRTGWLFTSNQSSVKNFIKGRVLEAMSSDILYSDEEQKGNPTYDLDLVECMKFLIEKNIIGVYNCVNKGVATRAEYVRAILAAVKSPSIVKGVPHSHFKRKAPVSVNESAINYKLHLRGIYIMRPWKEALNDAISNTSFVQ